MDTTQTIKERVEALLAEHPEGCSMRFIRSKVGGNPGAVRNAVNKLINTGLASETIRQDYPHSYTRVIKLEAQPDAPAA